jgi:hypothetical protein
VRSLVETGALEGERGAYRLTRPIERLKAILAARIDRLTPRPSAYFRLLPSSART